MPKSAMPVDAPVSGVPEVLPADDAAVLPAVPEVLPAPLPVPVLPARLPWPTCPAEGRAALAAALDGANCPAGSARVDGELVRESCDSWRWDDAEISQAAAGSCATVADLRGRRGRDVPAGVPAGAAAGSRAWPGTANWTRPSRNGPRRRPGRAPGEAGRARWTGTGNPRRPDATTLGRALAAGAATRNNTTTRCARGPPPAPAHCGPACAATCGSTARRCAAPLPGGGRAPMLLSGIWDDGTTAAQLAVDVKKTNEIPVFRQLLREDPGRGARGRGA